MATYAELKALYDHYVRTGQTDRAKEFLNDHPNFKDRLGMEGAFTDPRIPVGGGDSPWTGGTPESSGAEAPPAPEPTRPPKPTVPADLLKQGWDYVWDEDTKTWVLEQTGEKPKEVDVGAQNALRAELETILDQFGLKTQGNVSLIEKAVREDWSPTKFLQELRQSADYLANPLFAANLERARAGNGFMPEGQVIAYAAEAKRLAKQFGYQEPSDNYIAGAFSGGMSVAEFEHRLTVQERIKTFGAGVALRWKELTGDDPTDEDIYKVFDKEFSTVEFDRKARQAEYQGRPFTLGLGIRTEAEARALEMLGVNPDEAFSRYQNVAANATRMQRLGSIESMIAQGLPQDFGANFGTTDNSLLIRGLVFQDQAALAELQQIASREVARFKTSGGVAGQQGQLTGLLSTVEKQSYG